MYSSRKQKKEIVCTVDLHNIALMESEICYYLNDHSLQYTVPFRIQLQIKEPASSSQDLTNAVSKLLNVQGVPEVNVSVGVKARVTMKMRLF